MRPIYRAGTRAYLDITILWLFYRQLVNGVGNGKPGYRVVDLESEIPVRLCLSTAFTRKTKQEIRIERPERWLIDYKHVLCFVFFFIQRN